MRTFLVRNLDGWIRRCTPSAVTSPAANGGGSGTKTPGPCQARSKHAGVTSRDWRPEPNAVRSAIPTCYSTLPQSNRAEEPAIHGVLAAVASRDGPPEPGIPAVPHPDSRDELAAHRNATRAEAPRDAHCPAAAEPVDPPPAEAVHCR